MKKKVTSLSNKFDIFGIIQINMTNCFKNCDDNDVIEKLIHQTTKRYESGNTMLDAV